MTSLLGRLLRLFPESVPLEDLFTEALTRLFEKKPQLCIAWLEEEGLISPSVGGEIMGYIRVETQKSFSALQSHETDSRPDLLIEVFRSLDEESAEEGASGELVMIESKIGSREGSEQLRRYAQHLNRMAGFDGKTLAYITRSYDPKEANEILSGLNENVNFKQLRWHDFYRFLTTVEEDALIEEVKLFMEEQGMARSYRFSTTDLMALSGLPRAYEIFDETLGGEVRAELEAFTGGKISKREAHTLNQIRHLERYVTVAPLHGVEDLFCFIGYSLSSSDGYPEAIANLEARPGAVGREISVAAMKSISLNEDWSPYNLDNPSYWAGVGRSMSFSSLLAKEDHVAALQCFFIESINQLREKLTEFKRERPDLLWSGE